MGLAGPVPKRSEDRLGHSHGKAQADVTKAPAGQRIVPSPPDPHWHHLAKKFYLSLGLSGQSVFYEASDWAAAYYIAEVMHRNLGPGKFNGVLFAAIISAMSNLGVTEGDRRRMGLELQHNADHDADEDAAVLALAGYRRDAGLDTT